MNKIKAIIIDDEPLARLNTREALMTIPHWEVVAEFESGDISETQLAQFAPDVLFLDIQMPGENGISLAKRINNYNNPPLIIFVTAYDKYAIDAFELHAIDYLLKPFDSARFRQSIERAEQQIGNLTLREKNLERLQSFFEQSNYLNNILIKSIGTMRVINIESVIWLSSSGNYVEVHHNEGNHLHRESLSSLEEKLDPGIFVRVHRQAIVKLSEVREIKTLPENKHKLVLSNGDETHISKRFKCNLIDKIDQ